MAGAGSHLKKAPDPHPYWVIYLVRGSEFVWIPFDDLQSAKKIARSILEDEDVEHVLVARTIEFWIKKDG